MHDVATCPASDDVPEVSPPAAPNKAARRAWGDRLRRERVARKLTRKQFGEHLGGLADVTIGNWETGHGRPSELAWMRLVAELPGLAEHPPLGLYKGTPRGGTAPRRSMSTKGTPVANGARVGSPAVALARAVRAYALAPTDADAFWGLLDAALAAALSVDEVKELVGL